MTFADHSRPLLVVCHKWVNEEANTDLSIITELITQCFVLIMSVFIIYLIFFYFMNC